MESKAGSILLLISGIITLLISLIFMILAIVIPIYGVGEGSLALGAGFMIVFFVIALIFGLLKLWASSLMKKPETTVKGGIIALIVGIVGGFELLSIIGGILGIVQGGK